MLFGTSYILLTTVCICFCITVISSAQIVTYASTKAAFTYDNVEHVVGAGVGAQAGLGWGRAKGWPLDAGLGAGLGRVTKGGGVYAGGYDGHAAAW